MFDLNCVNRGEVVSEVMKDCQQFVEEEEEEDEDWMDR